MAQRLRPGRPRLAVSAALCGLLAWPLSAAHAAGPSAPWRWYYAAYGSPAPEARLFVRTGTARVAVDGAALRMEFTEDTPAPGERARFVGKLEAGKITGRLLKFFPSGDEARQGEVREQHTANCHWREIALRPEVPDGSVLIVSRIDGACQ